MKKPFPKKSPKKFKKEINALKAAYDLHVKRENLKFEKIRQDAKRLASEVLALSVEPRGDIKQPFNKTPHKPHPK